MSDPHRVSDIPALEALYGEPSAPSLRKVSPVLTPAYQAMIEASPMFALATTGPGGLDCSPRGDAGQAAFVLDEKRVAVPDRRGNNRLDSLRNIVEDPRVALLFFVPGVHECVRINGTAHLTIDPGLIERFTIAGKAPATVIVVEISELYFQCARALIRSSVWEPAKRRDRKALPSAGEMTRSAFAEFNAESYDAALPDRQAKTLY